MARVGRQSHRKRKDLITRRLSTMLCGRVRFNGYLSFMVLILNLLTTTIVALPSNASKWQMGFNLAFKGLIDM